MNKTTDINQHKLKKEVEAMKSEPWSFGHLVDCLCSPGDDLDIFEMSHPEGGFYCASVTCNKCGKEAQNTSEEPADVIWNRENKK